MLIRQKVLQAVQILNECEIDCWLTFVRESSISGEPTLPFLSDSDVTWHSAFLITRSGQTHAIVGQLEKKSVEDLGVYQNIIGYIESVREPLLAVLKKINPARIAINYSQSSEVCDGLTHGMYLTLIEILKEEHLDNRIISSEKVISKLRARKTDYELDCIRRAIDHTLDIYSEVSDFLRAGKTEKEIAAFILQEVRNRKLDLAWDEAHCPAVFTGPDTAGAHYGPTDRMIEHGHVLNMDFGVKVDQYCSDLQRTFYVLEPGETKAPEEVERGFCTIVSAIEKARSKLVPGAIGRDVDAAARQELLDQGYEGFPHGLGHQVGRFAHDGTALLGPPWEKYAGKPFEPIEEGMVFTLEPRLMVPGRGVVTIEEMVVVRPHGAEYLSRPQKELILI